MKTAHHGTHIGSTYTGTVAYVDDIIFTAWLESEMMIFFTSWDRLNIHLLKTYVIIIMQAEMEHLQTTKIWNINKEAVPVGWVFT